MDRVLTCVISPASTLLQHVNKIIWGWIENWPSSGESQAVSWVRYYRFLILVLLSRLLPPGFKVLILILKFLKDSRPNCIHDLVTAHSHHDPLGQCISVSGTKCDSSRWQHTPRFHLWSEILEGKRLMQSLTIGILGGSSVKAYQKGTCACTHAHTHAPTL